MPIPLSFIAMGGGSPVGQQAFFSATTHSWVAPAGVTSVCVVAIGAGSTGSPYTGGNGGDLVYSNNITVIPGNTYTVRVGFGGYSPSSPTVREPGGDSYFSADGGTTFLVLAKGGLSSSTSVGNTINTGGANIEYSYRSGCGAAGYTGSGANGVGSFTNGNSGSGGGGGSGGGPTYTDGPPAVAGGSGGGGGVEVYGQGSNGAGGSFAFASSSGGGGGSGGQSGSAAPSQYVGGAGGGRGGGGGSGAVNFDTGETYYGADGGSGAVRIIWGTGRSFPSTNTGDL